MATRWHWWQQISKLGPPRKREVNIVSIFGYSRVIIGYYM